MQYLGGKKRISKYICKLLNNEASKKNYSYYLEPFVGSCAIIENIEFTPRYGNDANHYLISLYRSLQNGWVPPKNLSEEEYQHIKQKKDENSPLTAFAGFGCSFSGKWFGGYSRSRKTKRNYALNAHNTLLKQLPKIKTVIFTSRDYKDCDPENALIYCDPPYSGTTPYDFFDNFNTEEFWNIMRKWSQKNTVFISEYVSPDDFQCVLEINTRTDLKNKEGKMIPRVEKIFQYMKKQ